MNIFNYLLASGLFYTSAYVFIDSIKKKIILHQISSEKSLFIINWFCLTASGIGLIVGFKEIVKSV